MARKPAESPRGITPFGERLRKAMAHAELGQQQLADKVGISQSTIGEAYKSAASKYTVQIAMACHVRPEWLATGEGDMLTEEQKLHPDARRLAEVISNLPPVQRDAVLRTAFVWVEGVFDAIPQKVEDATPEQTRMSVGSN